MANNQLRFSGVTSVIQTPFDEAGGLDMADLTQEVAWLVGSGVEAVSFGFASEIRRMTDDDRDRATEVAVRATDGRVPVVAAVVSGSTRATVERCRAAAHAGAAAALVPPPTDCPQDQDAIIAFYESVAHATDLALVVQDAPIQSGVSMDVATLLHIANHVPHVAALKLEAPPTVPKLAAVRRSLPEDIPVLGGAGGQDLLHELAAGAAGTMPGAAFPATMQGIVTSFHDGDLDTATRLFTQILPFIALARHNSDTFAFVNKEVLRRLGVITAAHLCPPAMRISDTLLADLDRVLELIDEAHTLVA